MAFGVHYNTKAWTNLTHWIECYYKHEFPGLEPYDEVGTLVNHMPQVVFALVRKLAKAGAEWDRVATALEDVHTLLQLQRTSW